MATTTKDKGSPNAAAGELFDEIELESMFSPSSPAAVAKRRLQQHAALPVPPVHLLLNPFDSIYERILGFKQSAYTIKQQRQLNNKIAGILVLKQFHFQNMQNNNTREQAIRDSFAIMDTVRHHNIAAFAGLVFNNGDEDENDIDKNSPVTGIKITTRQDCILNLQQYLDECKQSGTSISWDNKFLLALDISEAFRFLHSKYIQVSDRLQALSQTFSCKMINRKGNFHL